MTIYLVACVAKKAAYAMPAREIYQSEWFQRARAFVESTGAEWRILSAAHGLLHPGTVILPYDSTLTSMGIDKRREWAANVRRRITNELPAGGRCVVLAGQRYREFLIDFLRSRYDVEVPMQGMGIGHQLQFLGAK